ncbi:MAG TPA: peroxiredoxin-like family protein [Kofleriaceae bacterium]
MRYLLAVIAFAVACTPAPVIRPDHPSQRQQVVEPQVERTVELTNAPGGTVTTRDGGHFDIASAWATKPAVVIFYRGHWCPHCQYQMSELQKHRQDFVDRGVTIIAISSDEPADLTSMRDKLGLTFELYSDTQLAVIQQWGVEDFGNGIAKPATFIVQPGGAITFQKVGVKPDDRPSVAEIENALDAGATPAAAPAP